MKQTLTTLLLLLACTTALGKDIKKIVVTTTPPMHCDNCEKRIKGNLRFEKGVKNIETNIEQQTVTITYDADKTNPETLLKAFPKFNYQARIVEQPRTQPAPSSTTPKIKK